MLNCGLTVFLGDTDSSLATAAKLYDPQAQLVDYLNYEQFLESCIVQSTTVYTSLGDLPKNLEIIFSILTKATKIVYCPPIVWSDNNTLDFADPGSSMQGLTETLLRLLPNSVIVEGLPGFTLDPLPLTAKRKSNRPQMWNVGCSISHGDGVTQQERYGQLLSDALNMPCSFLTMTGSAIDWAADQILRSDIRKKDLIVWGVTSPERFTYINDNKLVAITPRSYQTYPHLKKLVNPVNLYSQDTIYKHMYAIQRVVNFCKKCQATLLLVGLLPGSYSLLAFLKNQKNYIQIPYHMQGNNQEIFFKFIDLGSDNEHPGPQQHKQYKNTILDKLKQLEII